MEWSVLAVQLSELKQQLCKLPVPMCQFWVLTVLLSDT